MTYTIITRKCPRCRRTLPHAAWLMEHGKCPGTAARGYRCGAPITKYKRHEVEVNKRAA